MRFPVQQQKLDPGDQVFDPVTTQAARATVVAVDAVAGTLRLRRGPTLEDGRAADRAHPGRRVDDEASSRRHSCALGRSLLAGDGRYPHLEKLLRREPPLGGARVQCEDARGDGAARPRGRGLVSLRAGPARRGQDVDRARGSSRT